MSQSSSSSSGGIGFVGLLQVAFIVLKLTGVIHWSWWWVLSPFLFTAGFSVLLFGLFCVAALSSGSTNSKRTTR